MSRGWRDIDPKWAKNHDALLNRITRLRKELENLTLAEFAVDDLPALCRVMGIGIGPLDHPSERDLELIERRIKEIKTRKVER